MANKGEVITEDEAELYDRQIRLWGLEAQKRLRVTKLLLVGLGGLGSEVCKNIVLAGIKAITLMDDQNITEEDFFSQFLVTRDDLGKNRATASVARVQELNPNVIVTSDESSVSDKDEEFFKGFDIVCLTCCKLETMIRVNTICHENNIQFFGGDIYGFYGYAFTDLNEHHFVEEKPKKVKGSSSEGSSKKQKVDSTETVFVKRTMHFTRLKEALEKKWAGTPEKEMKRVPPVFFMLQVLLKFQETMGRKPKPQSVENDRSKVLELKKKVLDNLGVQEDLVKDEFAGLVTGELSPVCAIVGGIVGQEMIKAASKRNAPHNNFFFYDGYDSVGYVDCIKDS